MTAKTSDFSGLLFYNPAGPGFDPVPQATIHCPDSMDEGDRITVDLVTWGIPDGTELRHIFPVVGLDPATRFSVSPRFPVVTNNRASFYVEVFADHATAPGSQSFDIIIQNKLTGLTLATKAGIIVNDTSQDPALMMDLDPKNYSPPIVTFADASGYSHNGTLVGTPTFTSAGTNGDGNYFTLNGTSQYITVPSLLNSAYGSVTMSLWFNSSTGVGSLITKELSYKMRLNAGGSLAVLASRTGTGWQYNSTNIVDIVTNDAWHHFAVSIGPDFVDWYLDGTRIQHEAGMGVNIHSSTRGVQIGGYDSDVPSELFTGKIGPARLYNYALTSQEVTTYYNATKGRYQTTPTPTYELTTQDSVTSVDEGVALTFIVTTTNVADGTTLYWGHGDNFNAGQTGRFSPDHGTVTINSNAGSFALTVSADNTTAIVDPQQYIVHLYSGNYGGFGGVEVASLTVTVNDTSQSPTVTYPNPGGLNGGLHDRTWDATWDQTFAWFGSHSTSFDQISYGSGHGFGQPGNPYGPATARLEGYFAPTQAGSYTFTLVSDNSAWAWVGNNVATASIANSNLSTGGITSITVSLVPGDFYPILVVYTQGSNGPEQAGFTLFASGTGITGSINSWPGDGYGWH